MLAISAAPFCLFSKRMLASDYTMIILLHTVKEADYDPLLQCVLTVSPNQSWLRPAFLFLEPQ